MQITELAWAAGFFDGEGCTLVTSQRKIVRLNVHQVDLATLERLRRALFDLGSIHGPYLRGTNKPIYQYRVSGFNDVQACIAAMWPFLCTPKKEQATRCLRVAHREHNSWKRQRCKRGHPYEGNRDKHGRCTPCLQAYERARPPRRRVRS